MEAACEKMLKDSVVFRDSVSGELSGQTGWHLAYRTGLLYSGSSFSGSLATLFSPLGAEYNLAAKHPNSEITLKNITQYQSLMEEMRGGSEGTILGGPGLTVKTRCRPSWSSSIRASCSLPKI